MKLSDYKKEEKESEGDIQNSICEYLETRGRGFFRLNNIPAFSKNPNGSIRMRALPKYTPRGLPDIIVIAGGTFIGLEVKRSNPKTYQSPDQKLFEALVKKHNGKYFVVRSISDVQAIGL
jgi:hypothetical protein